MCPSFTNYYANFDVLRKLDSGQQIVPYQSLISFLANVLRVLHSSKIEMLMHFWYAHPAKYALF